MKKLLVLLFVAVSTIMFLSGPCFAVDGKITLTEDEIIFVNEHPVIRLGVDPAFVPFEFIDKDGRYKGITADLLSLVSDRTGLRFEITPGLSWPEAYDLALSGEVDALPAISRTDERETLPFLRTLLLLQEGNRNQRHRQGYLRNRRPGRINSGCAKKQFSSQLLNILSEDKPESVRLS
jgi:hypothetical protein